MCKKIIALLVIVSVFELETISVSDSACQLALRPVNLKLTLDSFGSSRRLVWLSLVEFAWAC